MRNKQKLSYDEHIEYGKELRLDSEGYMNMHLTLCKKYGKTSREARAAERILNYIDHLKDLMDEKVFIEYGEKTTEELISVYYGSRKT
jgi:hypothetical protein